MVQGLLYRWPNTRLSDLLDIAELPRSSYYERVKKQATHFDKDHAIKQKIKAIVEENNSTYGYRRVCIVLRIIGGF